MFTKQILNDIKFLKVRYFNSRKRTSTSVNNYNVFYTIKFYTLYLPSSMKDIRLYSRSRIRKDENKILIKQSYLILIWLKYITSTNLSKDYDKSSSDIMFDNSKKVPSFFVYPCRLYKFTTIKSPMAHKTFSQEQFFCKNYKLSISFNSKVGSTNSLNLMHINNSLYFTTFFFNQMPSIGTNMLLIQRITLRFFF
jgi:ribosomal protein S10